MHNSVIAFTFSFDALETGFCAAGAAAFTAIGLFALVFGYRYYRTIAALQGMFIGAVLGAAGGMWLFPEQPMLIYLTALLAIGVLTPIFYYLSIFLIGFGTTATLVAGLIVLGMFLADVDMTTAAGWTVGIIGGICGLAGGILALNYHRMVVIVMTSLWGASMGVNAALIASQVQPEQLAASPWKLAMMILVTVALAIVGIVVQRKATSPAASSQNARPRPANARAAQPQ